MPTLEPVTPQPHLHAFAGYGIELEYMIVDRETLAVRPLADRLLAGEAGEIVNEVVVGELAWSNELVMHVIELKTNGPAGQFAGLAERFGQAIEEINLRLSPLGAMLLPTAMHPLFEPDRDTRLWPYGQNEIYAAYDRIFDCRGHGWSNLQSMHINLPFADNEEFARLHAAIRLVLPLLPGLAAASPVLDGRRSGWMDTRLRYYRDNQKRIPAIAGEIVPEGVDSIDDYHQRILAPMYQAVEPHDPDGILAEDWLNSRGAIARFERQTIEIRIIDIQECPAADLAIAQAVVALVRRLYDDSEGRLAAGQGIATESLAGMLFDAARSGGRSRIDLDAWLAIFDLARGVTVGEAWQVLAERGWLGDFGDNTTLARILARGTLAEAISGRLGPAPTRADIVDCYQELAACLVGNHLYLP